MERSDIEVLIGGEPFDAWKSLQIEHAVDQAVGTIDLKASVPDVWPDSAQSRVRVLVKDEAIFTGFFDKVDISLSPEGHTLEAQGRSLTADIVDSSFDPELQKTELSATVVGNVKTDGVELFEIALEYAQRALGVNVTHRLDEMPRLAKFVPQPGEPIYDLLERACRRFGVLITTDGDGRLVLTRPGKERAAESLVQGVNVQKLTTSIDHSERFRFIKVLGQDALSDSFFGDAALAASGEVEDEGVRTTRALVIMAEGSMDAAGCLARAQWEASARATRSSSTNVEVLDWIQKGGGVWRPNLLVPVDLPATRYQGDLLISSVSLSIDDQGSRAALELVRPDAYSPEPELAPEADPGSFFLAAVDE